MASSQAIAKHLFRTYVLQDASGDPLFNVDGCEYYSKSPEMFFRDGKRRIDFVIAYKKGQNSDDKEAKRFAFLSALAAQMIEIEVEDCHGNILASTGPAGKESDHSAAKLRLIEQEESAAREAVYDAIETNESNKSIQALEQDILAIQDLVFIKLHIAWTTLTRVAEVLQFRKPLKQKHLQRLSVNELTDCCRCLKPDPKEVKKLPTPYTAPFSRGRLYLFEIPKDYDEFFTPTERSVAVDFVLRRTGTARSSNLDNTRKGAGSKLPPVDTVSEKDVEMEVKSGARPEDIKLATAGKVDLGIDKLLNEGVFQAAFPLHEPSVDMLHLLMTKEQDQLAEEHGLTGSDSPKARKHENEMNMRIMLTEQWANLRKMFKYQPLDYVRLYFGESVALYFAWLGLYTTWLLPIGIFGLVIFCLGAIDISDDTQIEDVCQRGSQYVMCPPCNVKGCKFWYLNTSCFATKMTHLVDNGGTVAFAIIMALWATMFMERWKRYQNVLAYQWNVQNLEPVDEPPRPEFLALLDKRGYRSEINPVTGREEPVIPFWSRKVPILFITYAAVLFGVVLCLACLLGVIFYRLVIRVILLQNENAFVNSLAGIITTITSSCINLACIFVLKLVYDRVAVVMTNLENHRTQSEYDDSLTLKLYLLQFVNYYSSIFYIAFIQGTTAAIPGDDSVAIRSSGCDGGNCLFQLFIQLAIIMVGKQFLNFVTENTIPPIKRFIKVLLARRTAKKKLERQAAIRAAASSAGGPYGSLEPNAPSVPSAAEELAAAKQIATMYNCRSNYTLIDAGSRPLFEEYLEMLIQYGFITMFVPAFPVAPLFALLNNMFEIRTDASKFLRVLRRPVIKREKTIGIWFSILDVLSSIAIRTNACLIAFTTGFINRLVYVLYYSPTASMAGYTNFSLSYMSADRFTAPRSNRDILNGSLYCRYPDLRQAPWDPQPYEYLPAFWHILAIKFAFVFAFENVAIILTSMIATFIPDIPGRLSVVARHEARVINELILRGEIEDEEDKRAPEDLPPTTQPPIQFYNYEHPEYNEQYRMLGGIFANLIKRSRFGISP
uniref:Anoctamin n=1 Tax=Schistocephalus solidus TaxID=70667 RepID=A0A0X3NPU4_SCHSO